MKLVLIGLLLFTSNCLFAIEYKSKLVCKDGNCEKKETIKGLKSVDLKLADLKNDQCLLNLKTEKISRIELFDSKTKKIVILSEKEDLPTTVELLREIQWFDSKEFDRDQKVIPCSEVSGMLGDEERLSKCLKNQGKSVHSLFCEKERINKN